MQGAFVHGLNAAKYVAASLRARLVAQKQQRLMLWAVARDAPHLQQDGDPSGAETRQRRETWLQFHDQITGGIPGFLPMLPGLRVRRTLPDLRRYNVFKNTRGAIHSWALAPDDVDVAQACDQVELVLQHLPLCVFV